MEQETKNQINNLVKRFFHGAEGYNCAQAVIAISHELSKTSDKDIQEAKNWGGGRAENGYCGALYGALSVLPKECHANVIQKFQEEVGALRCQEIRPQQLKPCAECVAIAAKIVFDELKK